MEAISETVQPGDRIVLIDENLRKILIDTTAKTDRFPGVGVLDPATLAGKTYGSQITIGSKHFWVLVPSVIDKMQGLRRRAQIILPRDASHILLQCNISSGRTVLEAGIGSGSLTIALATAVAPTGKVISYDLREDFIEHAKTNLEQAGLAQYVTTRQKDVTAEIEDHDLDAVILDIPTPWLAVGHAWTALHVGGYLCSYSPLISQVEQTVREIRKHPYIECTTYEHLEREMVVSEHGTRPGFEMLGHTGYLTFARKVLQQTPQEPPSP